MKHLVTGATVLVPKCVADEIEAENDEWVEVSSVEPSNT